MKPKLIKNILLEGSIVGAIMLDNGGYFYRPKWGTKISTTSHSKVKDGEHKPSILEVEKSVYGETP